LESRIARTVIVVSLNRFAPPKELDLFASLQSTFRAGSVSGAVKQAADMYASKLCLVSQHVKMMDEIALRRKRRSDAVNLVRR
jgi:hypothetical protein